MGEPQPIARDSRQNWAAIAALIRSKEVWLLCVFNSAVNVGWIFLVSWLPQYLVESHGSELLEIVSQFYARYWPQYRPEALASPGGDKMAVAGVMTALTGLTGIVGGLIGGASTDLLRETLDSGKLGELHHRRPPPVNPVLK